MGRDRLGLSQVMTQPLLGNAGQFPLPPMKIWVTRSEGIEAIRRSGFGVS